MTLLTGSRFERARASRQFRNGRFHNTHPVTAGLEGSTAKVMSEFFFGGKSRRPSGPLPVESPLATWAHPVETGLRVTWLGHSSLVIEIDGFRILTDPVFGPRASPVSFAGTKRFHPPPVSVAELPPLDVVLISHDHYDHLCRATIRQLATLRVPFVTSLGVGARLEQFGVDPALITELDWWQEQKIAGGQLRFTAAPAQHFSGRTLRDRNVTLWSSWVIATEQRRLFFSGDTGLTDELADIGRRLGPFELSMIEIGAANPAWHGIHLGPENALKAFSLLGGGTLLPIHWGTFDLALHRWDEPIETLLRLGEPIGVKIVTPRLGRPIEPSRVDGPTPWWRGIEATRAIPASDPLGAR